MNHLREQNMTYFQHLFHSWSMAFVLIIHGLLPCVWTDYVSNKICKDK